VPADMRLHLEPIVSRAGPSIHISKVIADDRRLPDARFVIESNTTVRELERAQVGSNGM
jgi:hypothetical protein